MNDPHVNVRNLEESESWVRSLFAKPEIQYIGSTTACGCGFPSAMQQGVDWPHWLDPVKDAEIIASDQEECKELCQIFSQLDENEIELYGIWAGNEGNDPLIREKITLDDIRREYFCFKEGGFYRVKLR